MLDDGEIRKSWEVTDIHQLVLWIKESNPDQLAVEQYDIRSRSASKDAPNVLGIIGVLRFFFPGLILQRANVLGYLKGIVPAELARSGPHIRSAWCHAYYCYVRRGKSDGDQGRHH